MGERKEREAAEIKALQRGFDLGLTHVDTAEMYQSEELVGKAIRGRRQEIFLVSKVLPSNATYEGTLRACERSLKRLRCDYLDVYLLHWWGSYPIEETMRAMAKLVEQGKTRFIGVSNLEPEELESARAALPDHPLVCDQVLYHLDARACEHTLLPYCRKNRVALVGYSPFAQDGFPPPKSPKGKVLEQIARRHGVTPRQVALNFLVREEETFTIPKAASVAHVEENAASLNFSLTAEDVQAINRAFPPPRKRVPLGML